MKYLSLLMVAVIVALSWILMKTTSNDLSAEQYTKLQSVIQEYLAVYLKETNPLASDIEEPHVKIRLIEPAKRMQAEFKFFYTVPGDDGSINRIAREGYFTITSENGNDWVAKMEKINDSYVEFSEALQISLNGDIPTTPEPDNQDAPTEKKEEPKKK
jgi:hypothetical protein